MEKMRELYEKVAGDKTLQAKFEEIMNNAEHADKEETELKLAAFAKEAGYDINLDEMSAFFKQLAEKNNGQLSDTELDMVAGGKSLSGIFHVFSSVASAGISCAVNSAAEEAKHRSTDGILSNCKDYFS